MIQLSCENKDVLALAEDQLITSSLEKRNLIGKNIDLIYTTDNMVKRRIYILIKYKLLCTDMLIVHGVTGVLGNMATKMQQQNVF